MLAAPPTSLSSRPVRSSPLAGPVLSHPPSPSSSRSYGDQSNEDGAANADNEDNDLSSASHSRTRLPGSLSVEAAASTSSFSLAAFSRRRKKQDSGGDGEGDDGTEEDKGTASAFNFLRRPASIAHSSTISHPHSSSSSTSNCTSSTLVSTDVPSVPQLPPTARVHHSRAASLPHSPPRPLSLLPSKGAPKVASTPSQPPATTGATANSTTSPFGPAEIPRFSRATLKQAGVVMPLSAKEYRKRQSVAQGGSVPPGRPSSVPSGSASAGPAVRRSASKVKPSEKDRKARQRVSFVDTVMGRRTATAAPALPERVHPPALSKVEVLVHPPTPPSSPKAPSLALQTSMQSDGCSGPSVEAATPAALESSKVCESAESSQPSNEAENVPQVQDSMPPRRISPKSSTNSFFSCVSSAVPTSSPSGVSSSPHECELREPCVGPLSTPLPETDRTLDAQLDVKARFSLASTVSYVTATSGGSGECASGDGDTKSDDGEEKTSSLGDVPPDSAQTIPGLTSDSAPSTSPSSFESDAERAGQFATASIFRTQSEPVDVYTRTSTEQEDKGTGPPSDTTKVETKDGGTATMQGAERQTQNTKKKLRPISLFRFASVSAESVSVPTSVEATPMGTSAITAAGTLAPVPAITPEASTPAVLTTGSTPLGSTQPIPDKGSTLTTTPIQGSAPSAAISGTGAPTQNPVTALRPGLTAIRSLQSVLSPIIEDASSQGHGSSMGHGHADDADVAVFGHEHKGGNAANQEAHMNGVSSPHLHGVAYVDAADGPSQGTQSPPSTQLPPMPTSPQQSESPSSLEKPSKASLSKESVQPDPSRSRTRRCSFFIPRLSRRSSKAEERDKAAVVVAQAVPKDGGTKTNGTAVRVASRSSSDYGSDGDLIKQSKKCGALVQQKDDGTISTLQHGSESTLVALSTPCTPLLSPSPSPGFSPSSRSSSYLVLPSSHGALGTRASIPASPPSLPSVASARSPVLEIGGDSVTLALPPPGDDRVVGLALTSACATGMRVSACATESGGINVRVEDALNSDVKAKGVDAPTTSVAEDAQVKQAEMDKGLCLPNPHNLDLLSNAVEPGIDIDPAIGGTATAVKAVHEAESQLLHLDADTDASEEPRPGTSHSTSSSIVPLPNPWDVSAGPSAPMVDSAPLRAPKHLPPPLHVPMPSAAVLSPPMSCAAILPSGPGMVPAHSTYVPPPSNSIQSPSPPQALPCHPIVSPRHPPTGVRRPLPIPPTSPPLTNATCAPPVFYSPNYDPRVAHAQTFIMPAHNSGFVHRSGVPHLPPGAMPPQPQLSRQISQFLLSSNRNSSVVGKSARSATLPPAPSTPRKLKRPQTTPGSGAARKSTRNKQGSASRNIGTGSVPPGACLPRSVEAAKAGRESRVKGIFRGLFSLA